jgi:hypothetical protein
MPTSRNAEPPKALNDCAAMLTRKIAGCQLSVLLLVNCSWLFAFAGREGGSGPSLNEEQTQITNNN